MAVKVAQVAVDARYRVLSLFCCVAGIAYIQRAAMGVPAGEIAHGLGSSDLARDMGYVQSAWYAGYALLQLPSGWLADRLGSRITVLILAALVVANDGCCWQHQYFCSGQRVGPDGRGAGGCLSMCNQGYWCHLSPRRTGASLGYACRWYDCRCGGGSDDHVAGA